MQARLLLLFLLRGRTAGADQDTCVDVAAGSALVLWYRWWCAVQQVRVMQPCVLPGKGFWGIVQGLCDMVHIALSLWRALQTFGCSLKR